MLTVSLIVAFIVSVLSGMGVGGGGLFVIYLALFTDVPQLQIQGINLAFFLFSSLSSITIHLRKRRIFTSSVLSMATTGIVGAILGSLLSARIEQSILRKMFGIMLLFTGGVAFKSFISSKKE